LKKLFKSLYSKLYALAYRLTGEQEVAEQIVIDVFIDLWKNRSEIDTFSLLSPILLREVYQRASSTDRPASSTGGNVSSSIARHPHLKNVVEKLAEIDNGSRLVFLLSTADGFSYREIARTLDLSEEAILHYMGKALSQLEPTLTPNDPII
jgi:RNA polymerase sigma-70 factor (ECF subfamily)